MFTHIKLCSEVCDVKFCDVNVQNEWTETPIHHVLSKLLALLTPDVDKNYSTWETPRPNNGILSNGLTLFWVMKTALHGMTIVKLILSSYNW